MGEDDVIGVELLGEGHDLSVVEIAERFAGGEEGLAAVVDDHAGLESVHAVPPGFGEGGGKVKLGAIAPFADDGAFGVNAEAALAGGGEEEGILGSVIAGPKLYIDPGGIGGGFMQEGGEDQGEGHGGEE